MDTTCAQSGSLNSNPCNMLSEELAMQDCTLGVDVRRSWSETEMVRSFGGTVSPGTPDGMFENWDGILTCVQVVRVPIVSGLSPEDMQETIAQTVLTKVVKSQHWLRASNVTPTEFIIFCWLPFPIPDAVAGDAETLMQRVQELDPRFSLRMRVPSDAHALFPARFACNHDVAQRDSKYRSWSDVATYSGSSDADSDDDDDACFSWDITWSWEKDPSCDVGDEEYAESDGHSCESGAEALFDHHETEAATTAAQQSSQEDDWECNWDVVWDDGG